MVLQLLSVKLIEGLAGIWFSRLPQYLMSAILLGDSHETLSLSKVFEYFWGIKCCSVILT
jgi:hypothetical protein